MIVTIVTVLLDIYKIATMDVAVPGPVPVVEPPAVHQSKDCFLD